MFNPQTADWSEYMKNHVKLSAELDQLRKQMKAFADQYTEKIVTPYGTITVMKHMRSDQLVAMTEKDIILVKLR